jgi:hypothetical protein
VDLRVIPEVARARRCFDRCVTAQGGRQTKEATMTTSTYLIRFTRLLVLCAVVAGTIASVAGAYDARPPDVQDAATALHTTAAGLKADGLRWQGIAQVYRDLEPAGNGPTAQGLRADGLRWQGIAKVYQEQQSVVSSGAAFDWGDWAIGLVAGFGLAVGVAGGVLLASHRIARTGRTGATAAG